MNKQTALDNNYDFESLIKELKNSLNNYEKIIIKLEKNNDSKAIVFKNR